MRLILAGGTFVVALLPIWPCRLTQGNFHGVSADGGGLVTVEREWLGRRSVRLSGIDPGVTQPLQVRLISADDAFDDATAKDTVFVAIGQLHPGQTTASFPLPAGVDLDSFRAVIVWSEDLQRNLMTAPLRSTHNFPMLWNQ